MNGSLLVEVKTKLVKNKIILSGIQNLAARSTSNLRGASQHVVLISKALLNKGCVKLSSFLNQHM